ncbi:MAG: permease-like cell division protein FtsX [Bacteroidetes bacterium]|nr:permease-like cell division protein FtsX [Bacteroidota bacterium]MDA0873997.1 permease-like cell division protein FtsX [Bacteroidota bacterium]
MLPYTIKEGLSGFKRASFSSVAATSAMTVALVLVGLFAVVIWQARGVSEWLKQRVGEVELFLDDVHVDVAEALYERARATAGVAQAEFISKERAQQIFRQEFGEEAEVFFDGAFLPASIRVRVEPDYINTDSLNALVAEFSSWNRVDEVVYNRPLLAKVQDNLRLLSIIGVSIGLLVLLASIFLVANTIRLAIYARRLMIRTMKLVGATDGFIRKPFIVEGILQGMISAVLALFILWVMEQVALALVPQLSGLPWSEALLFAAGLLVAGMILGWIGSESAVRRFLRQVSLH